MDENMTLSWSNMSWGWEENDTISGAESSTEHYLTTHMMSTATTVRPTTTPKPCYPSQIPRCDPFMIAVDGLVIHGSNLCYAIGFPGNLLTFIILLRMKPFNSSSVWLLCLAASDFLHLSFRAIHDLLMMKSVLGPYNFLSDTNCRLFHIPIKTFEYYSNWLLVGLTLERVIAVWFPLKMSVWCTRTKAAMGCAALFLLSLGPQLHMVETYRRHYLFAFCITKGKYRKFWSDVYNEKIMTSIFLLVPLILIVSANVLIVVGLKRASSFQKQSSESQTKERGRQQAQIYRMLTAASTWFFIAMTPFTIYHYARQTYPGQTLTADQYRIRYGVPVILDILRFTNVVANFVLYVVAANKFRQELIRLLTCGKFSGINVRAGATSAVQKTKMTSAVSVSSVSK